MSSMMNGMVFRRRRDGRRPIDSNKNVVNDIIIVAAAATDTAPIATAVDGAVLANAADVERACTINQIYCEVWIYGNAVAGVNSRMSWNLVKNPGNNLVLPDPSVVGTNDNKRWVFAQGSGLVGAAGDGQPGYLVRGWFKVPRHMRRMAAGDRFQFRIKNDTANDLNVCQLFIYKWYK